MKTPIESLEINDVIQVVPGAKHVAPCYHGVFGVVDRIYPTGIRVYIPTVGQPEEIGKLIYLGLFLHQVSKIGQVHWIANEDTPDIPNPAASSNDSEQS